MQVPALSSTRKKKTAAGQQQPLAVTANNRELPRDSIDIDNAINSNNRKAKVRNSADAVTAAYTLRSRKNNASLPSRQPKERASEDHPTTTTMSTWSVNNIGFSDVKGEAQKAREREIRESYVGAVFAAQEADKPYIAEATHFRYRYPHTLGRITALSHARVDRAGTVHRHF